MRLSNLIDEEEVRAQARIYGKSGKEVTKYQRRLNEVAGDLCVRDPVLLGDRRKLLELAKDELHESGYVYAKGKSRSKKFNLVSEEEERPIKREKIDKQERQHRIETLKEQLQDNNKHISIKEKRIEQAQGVQNYKLCDQLSAEVTELKTKRREIESLLRALQRKEQRSAKYFSRKSLASGVIASDISSDRSHVASQDSDQPPPEDVTCAFEPGTSFL